MADDIEAKEQERLMRTMAKGRGKAPPAAASARPTSWNVQLSGRAVVGASKRNEQAEAFRALQEQIKNEEQNTPKEKGDDAFAVAVNNASNAEQPYQSPVKDATSPRPVSPPMSPHASNVTPLSLEEQAELAAINAFNEKRELERINKWTRGMGKEAVATPKKLEVSHDRPTPAVLMRQFDSDHPKPTSPVMHSTPVHSNPTLNTAPIPVNATTLDLSDNQKEEPQIKDLKEYQEGVAKFAANVAVTAKALRQQNSDAIVSGCYSVVMSAKVLASLANEDEEIRSWTKALECVSTELRSRLDAGRSGREVYSEIARSVGQLYLSVVSLA